MNELEEFRRLFPSAFRNPTQTEPRIQTERFSMVWVDMEPVGDWLAGPLYGINLRGECDYVFLDEEGRFPGVKTPDDFLRWCLAIAKKYRDGIVAQAPQSEAERSDQAILIEMADAMVTLSHLAHRITSNG